VVAVGVVLVLAQIQRRRLEHLVRVTLAVTETKVGVMAAVEEAQEQWVKQVLLVAQVMALVVMALLQAFLVLLPITQVVAEVVLTTDLVLVAQQVLEVAVRVDTTQVLGLLELLTLEEAEAEAELQVRLQAQMAVTVALAL